MRDRNQKDLFIALVDSSLRVFPRERITLQVLRYIKTHKRELVKYIQHVKKAFAPANTGKFSTANIAVKVHNTALNRDIYFLIDGKSPDLRSLDGLVAYLPSDIEHMIQFRGTAEKISKINVLQEVFPGSKIVWN